MRYQLTDDQRSTAALEKHLSLAPVCLVLCLLATSTSPAQAEEPDDDKPAVRIPKAGAPRGLLAPREEPDDGPLAPVEIPPAAAPGFGDEKPPPPADKPELLIPKARGPAVPIPPSPVEMRKPWPKGESPPHRTPTSNELRPLLPRAKPPELTPGWLHRPLEKWPEEPEIVGLERIHLGIYTSLFIPSGDFGLDIQPKLNLTAAWRWGPQSPLLISLSLGYATNRVREADDDDPTRVELNARVELITVDLEAIWELTPVAGGILTPRVIGGLGLTGFTGFPDEGDAAVPGLIIGIGGVIQIRDNVLFSMDLRIRLLYSRFRQDHNGLAADVEPSFGLIHTF